MVFGGDYSAIYDLLYADKPYQREVEYALAYARSHGVEPTTVVDYGCGTGRHAVRFRDAGCQVTGVDINPHMLALARRRAEGATPGTGTLAFIETADRDNIDPGSVDLFVTLFDVLSYMTTNAEVLDHLRFVRRCLRPGGVFLCDFWYGPGVIGLGPERRTREYRAGDLAVQRVVEPTVDWNASIVHARMDLLVTRGGPGSRAERITEVHSMRYFFANEIALFADAAGLALDRLGTWDAPERPPGTGDWSALAGFTTA